MVPDYEAWHIKCLFFLFDIIESKKVPCKNGLQTPEKAPWFRLDCYCMNLTFCGSMSHFNGLSVILVNCWCFFPLLKGPRTGSNLVIRIRVILLLFAVASGELCLTVGVLGHFEVPLGLEPLSDLVKWPLGEMWCWVQTISLVGWVLWQKNIHLRPKIICHEAVLFKNK